MAVALIRSRRVHGARNRDDNRMERREEAEGTTHATLLQSVTCGGASQTGDGDGDGRRELFRTLIWINFREGKG